MDRLWRTLAAAAMAGAALLAFAGPAAAQAAKLHYYAEQSCTAGRAEAGRRVPQALRIGGPATTADTLSV